MAPLDGFRPRSDHIAVGIRVMIVDDSAVMRNLVRRTLRQAKFEVDGVVEARNGVEALEAYREGAIDLVICDVHMPEMDGIELIRRLRARDPDVSIVVLSAEGSFARQKEAEELGVFDYLVKPVTAEQMARRVGPIYDRLAGRG
jgi:two-component system chemotaxis response regulator CheY